MIGFAIESIFKALDRVVGEDFLKMKELNPLKMEFYSEMFTKLTILYTMTIQSVMLYKPDLKIGKNANLEILKKPKEMWESFTGIFSSFMCQNNIFFLERLNTLSETRIVEKCIYFWEYSKTTLRNSTDLRAEVTQLKLEKSELEAKVEELNGLNATLQTKNEELLEEQFEWELERSQLMQQAKEAKSPKTADSTRKKWGFRKKKKMVNGGGVHI